MKNHLIFFISLAVLTAIIVLGYHFFSLELPQKNTVQPNFVDLHVEQKSESNTFVGSGQCQQCHSKQFSEWQLSDHSKSMQVASAQTVLGRFADTSVSFHGITTKFYQQGGKFLIDTLAGDNTRQTYEVSYTFGHFPLQQYLIKTNNGHIQAFNIAWDSRSKIDGGQRWFHLQPDEKISPEHPFFWTRHFQNWNSRCAECHSTELSRHYDSSTHSYDTQWLEINVACEACHGAASRHVSLAQSSLLTQEVSGFEQSLRADSEFMFNDFSAIAKNTGGSSPVQLELCASCHSRRSVIDEINTTQSYHNQFRLDALSQGMYFSDGQINDEVFVYGSFLQSKMYKSGVTCSNCHNPHSGKLVLEGNGLCLQCHKADVYQHSNHHQHKVNTEASLCVTCHMPERRYMQVDDRRDHSFSIPRPELAQRLDTPNACSSCHAEWSSEKLSQGYNQLFGKELEFAWAEANHDAETFNFLAINTIVQLANDQSIAAIRRASLLQKLSRFPTRVTLKGLQQALTDSSALVRQNAVDASSFLPPEQRYQLLQQLMTDPEKVVRMAVANQLADTLTFASSEQTKVLLNLLDDYEHSLLLENDKPGSLVNLGRYYSRRGDLKRAKISYEKALRIEGGYIPALINLADLYRAIKNEVQAEVYLKKALAVAPDSPDIKHSLGLLYVRKKQIDQALPLLNAARLLPSSMPFHSYVYAVAIASIGSTDKAVTVLISASERWPNNPDLLTLLVSYMDELELAEEILPHLLTLSRIAPANPQVQGLLRKYTR